MIEINGLMVGILLCDPLKVKIKNLPPRCYMVSSLYNRLEAFTV